MEIEEDKDQREKENSEEESKKDKDQVLDEEKDNRDDDDIGSNSKCFNHLNSLSRKDEVCSLKTFPLKITLHTIIKSHSLIYFIYIIR